MGGDRERQHTCIVCTLHIIHYVYIIHDVSSRCRRRCGTVAYFQYLSFSQRQTSHFILCISYFSSCSHGAPAAQLLLRTVYCVPSTSTPYLLLCAAYLRLLLHTFYFPRARALEVMERPPLRFYFVLCTVYFCTVHYALCTVYCVLVYFCTFVLLY